MVSGDTVTETDTRFNRRVSGAELKNGHDIDHRRTEHAMAPHVHISPVHMVAAAAATVAVFGTVHLLCLNADNRFTRAWVSLGF